MERIAERVAVQTLYAQDGRVHRALTEVIHLVQLIRRTYSVARLLLGASKPSGAQVDFKFHYMRGLERTVSQARSLE